MIGRSRGEAAADRRKDELNGYVWHLIHAAPDVAQVSRGRFTARVTSEEVKPTDRLDKQTNTYPHSEHE